MCIWHGKTEKWQMIKLQKQVCSSQKEEPVEGAVEKVLRPWERHPGIWAGKVFCAWGSREGCILKMKVHCRGNLSAAGKRLGFSFLILSSIHWPGRKGENVLCQAQTSTTPRRGEDLPTLKSEGQAEESGMKEAKLVSEKCSQICYCSVRLPSFWSPEGLVI